ncbi:MAG TPA: aminotransferase class IV [Acidimicrobiales bacterium]|nr:aminotransferase class IV [Acidimicrobiales bacterium]
MGASARAVWLNGEMVGPEDAVVSVFDHGFTVGDGVFETLKVVGGRPFAVRRHVERLHRSAQGLGIDVPLTDASLRRVVDEVVAAAGLQLARLRITLTAGVTPLGSGRGGGEPTLVVAAGPLTPWETDTTAVSVPWPRNDRSPVAGVKTTSYAENVVALAEARKVGATEAILPNTRGNLCEGTGSNVFVVLGGRLVTPPLMAGCLAGVTRALVLELLLDADEDDLPFAALAEADEVLLTSTTRDVQPLRQLDGRALPGVDGPVARRAMAAVADLQARDLDP